MSSFTSMREPALSPSENTGEVIYTSKAVPVGSKIESDKLDVDLDAGTYECTAMFFNLDPDTGDKLGSAGVVIELTVLE